MKRKFFWLKHLLKRIKPYSVIQCYDVKGNYEYSVLCLHQKIFNNCNNFIRIKYRADECEIEGDVGKRLKEDILKK